LFRLGLCLCVVLSAALAAAQTPVVPAAIRLDDSEAPCQGLRVAALGPSNVVVSWTVADGPRRGIYFRQRRNALWEPVRQVAGNTGDQPRDVDLAFDTVGRLHLVWTALQSNQRLLYHARLDGANATPQAAALKPPSVTDESGDADFPMIGPDAQGGVVVVWQESQAIHSVVCAARLLEDASLEDLGRVSGKSLSGMAPQIVATQPLSVAWYEISETGSDLRVDEWQSAEKKWRPSAIERQTRAFPPDMQLLLEATPLGLAACWKDILSDGRSAIKAGFALASNATPPAAPPVWATLADPPGDHSRPQLSGSLPGRMTLSWQVFTQGQQQIRLASLLQTDKQPEVVMVSSAAQRFAAMPDHVTIDAWSAVAWSDDARDGGSGGVYFNEINWSAGH